MEVAGTYTGVLQDRPGRQRCIPLGFRELPRADAHRLDCLLLSAGILPPTSSQAIKLWIRKLVVQNLQRDPHHEFFNSITRNCRRIPPLEHRKHESSAMRTRGLLCLSAEVSTNHSYARLCTFDASQPARTALSEVSPETRLTQTATLPSSGPCPQKRTQSPACSSFGKNAPPRRRNSHCPAGHALTK